MRRNLAAGILAALALALLTGYSASFTVYFGDPLGKARGPKEPR